MTNKLRKCIIFHYIGHVRLFLRAHLPKNIWGNCAILVTGSPFFLVWSYVITYVITTHPTVRQSWEANLNVEMITRFITAPQIRGFLHMYWTHGLGKTLLKSSEKTPARPYLYFWVWKIWVLLNSYRWTNPALFTERFLWCHMSWTAEKWKVSSFNFVPGKWSSQGMQYYLTWVCSTTQNPWVMCIPKACWFRHSHNGMKKCR